MKISKQTLLITHILILFFASACSKNLFQPDDPGFNPDFAKAETSSEPFEKPGSGPDFGSAKQGMPGDGSTGSFSAENSGANDSGSGSAPDTAIANKNNALRGDTFSPLYEKPEPRNFGSANQGMPGNGSAGSFSAEPYQGKATSPSAAEFFKEEDVGEFDTAARLFEKPGSGPDFGSAKQGMPGNGSTGSFSAEPYQGNGNESSPGFYEKFAPRDFGSAKQGVPGNGSTGSFSAQPFSGNNGEDAVSFLYEKPAPRSFGSAEKGMPGNGSAGSFSSEPFQTKDSLVASLPHEEEVRRQLSYSKSDSLQDIHFEFDMFFLTNKTRAILKSNVAYLKLHPDFNIEIQGHCDERGSNNYNIALGERRIRSTKAYLISQGIEEKRIHSISYGEEKPFCNESNERCWHQNRRAHFLIAE